MNNYIDPEKCTHCALCLEVCPVNNFGRNDKGEVFYLTEREDICLQCGQCMAVCPEEAVFIAGYSYGENFFPLPENTVDYSRFIDFLATRRSVRNFKDQPVPPELLERILDSLAFSPYGAAPEKLKVTVINDRTQIERSLPLIEKFLDDIVKWMENPVARYMMKRNAGVEAYHTVRNHLYPIIKKGNYKLVHGDRITRNAPAMILFHGAKSAEEHTNNALIRSTYAMLAAHALGLGATMNEIVPAAVNKVAELKKIFAIPEEDEVVISLILGYPEYKYRRAIRREV